MMDISGDEDEAPDDDAPEQDPDPAPPRQADVSIHEQKIEREGFTLGTDGDDVDVSFAPNTPQEFKVEDDGA